MNTLKSLRMISIAAGVAIVTASAIWNKGIGSFSALGVKDISAVCPLGYLETAIAGRTILPNLIIPFLVIIGLTVLLGRVFCGWICPIPIIRSWFRSGVKDTDTAIMNKIPDADAAPVSLTSKVSTRRSHGSQRLGNYPLEGVSILGAALLTSAIFRFPVFCLVCPIGLFFATIFALIRLFHVNEPSLDLIFFPIIICIEVVLLKKWCSRLCPLGALLGLFGRFNRNLAPAVDYSACLTASKGAKCNLCNDACDFDVDLNKDSKNLGHCVKCHDCADICPVKAISFPWKKP